MRRVLVALGIVLALTVLVVVAFVVLDEGTLGVPVRTAPVPAEVTPAAAPADEPSTAETPPHRDVVAPPVPRPVPRATPRAPTGRGRLEVSVRAPDGLERDVPCRLTLLVPTGAEIATQTTAGEASVVFANLPYGVPLVLRVSAPGFLTGLCCDLTLPESGSLHKDVELVRAPLVHLSTDCQGVRIELRQGDDVVAEGVTDRRGRVDLRVPVVGQLRATVSIEGAIQPETIVDVWTSDDDGVHAVKMTESGSVRIAVVTPRGDPAKDVDVWLMVDGSRWPSARTKRDGIATLSFVRDGAQIVAVARAPDGTVGRAVVTAGTDVARYFPLLLGDPAPLVGEVVDDGGSPVVGAQVEVVVRPFGQPVKVRTDDAGGFTTVPLPPGLADVVVRREGFVEWRCEKPVEVEPRVGANVRPRLHRSPTGAVVVTVRDESGKPVADAAVTLYPSRRGATTAADGRCRIDGIPSGVEQSVFAKRRGMRIRRSTGWTPPVVRVRADRAVDAEVVMAPVDARSSPSGTGVVTGLVLDPGNLSVVGARVDAGAASGFTDADGRFRLAAPAATQAGEPLAVSITPGAGLLEPLRCFLDVDDESGADLGTVRLRARPYARIVVPATGPRRSPAFWFSCNHADELLGRRTGRFQPIACVSYDGAWLHLPPADDWKDEGRGEAFVALPTPHGLRAAGARWTLTPDAAATLSPTFASSPRAVTLVNLPGRAFESTARFLQVECATRFEPKSVHVPSGDTLPVVDPFSTLLLSRRTFQVPHVRSDMKIADVAPGRWLVALDGDRDSTAVYVEVPDEWRVDFRR